MLKLPETEVASQLHQEKILFSAPPMIAVIDVLNAVIDEIFEEWVLFVAT